MILAFYSERGGDVTGIRRTAARIRSLSCVTKTITSGLFAKNTEDKWTIYVTFYPVLFFIEMPKLIKKHQIGSSRFPSCF